MPRRLLSTTLTLCTLPLAIACRDAEPAAGDTSGGDSSSDDDGSSTAAVDETGTEATVTYYETIKLLLDARCVSCHREGGIGPFSLATYEDAAAWSGAAVAAIHAGTMPPWPPADDCNEYAATRDLDDEEIALVDTWVAELVPMGDPALEGAPLVDGDPGLTRVDLAIDMPEAYTMVQTPDDYRT